MANTANKKYLTDENGDKFYPIGNTGAIYDSGGNTLDSVLNNKASSSHTHTKSDITDLSIDSTLSSTSTNPVQNKVVNSALDNKAATNHKSPLTKHGVGDNSYYGHVKLSDSLISVSNVNDGYAATPYAVKLAYDRITANYLNSYGTSGSWKAVYTNEGESLTNPSFGKDGGTVVFEGVSRRRTTFVLVFTNSNTDKKTIIFKDCTVRMQFEGEETTSMNFIFVNCAVEDARGELYRGSGDLTFINSDIQINCDDNDLDGDTSCQSGIITTGNVRIIGGNVSIEAGGMTNGYDSNFIYQAGKLMMQGVTVATSGSSSGRINIIRNCNYTMINGCHFYLNGVMHSIGHIADTDRTVGGTFTGNYVEYYKTYMRFGTISGNTFNHLTAGSSSAGQIVLQCPTCMTGNHFKGSTPYIDAQSQKVIVDRNLSDNTLTVGSTASGSVTTNNITY